MEHQDVAATVQACAEVVDMYRLRYGWKLLDRAAFVEQVYARAAAAPDPADLRRIALQIYTEALHRACSGAAGREQQECGYTELYQYLAHCAAQRFPDVRLDAAQNAIERVYRCFTCCRHPETFLAFALQKLRDAGRFERRQVEKGAVSLDLLHDAALLGADEPYPARADPLAHVITAELQQQIAAALQALLRQHPRATQQVMVLWLKYIADMDDGAISQCLGKSIACIHVLRSRGLAKLRADARWQRLATEYGFGPA